jgi:3,5-dihydroxyphenylacetyl-CoA synthase
LRDDCIRTDIVGMGCSAGLNGLNTTVNWCRANPDKNALLICVEICSAIYARDKTPRTAIVNSLFGDGAAVALIKKSNKKNTGSRHGHSPRVLDFESCLLPDHIDKLRFDWDESKNCYSFYIDKDTPQAIAAVADRPLYKLLGRHALEKNDISHWILHGGGNAVLCGIRDKLALSDNDLRHTRSVLKEFGNLSSGSFLFSFKKLQEEAIARSGDFGIMITMGPGLAIEMALIEW